MEADHLDELIDRVDSKESFLEFLRALELDFYQDAERWENGTISDFLSACRAWASSTSTLSGRPTVDDAPSWNAFAWILWAGKFHE